ncbi:glycosyltransferase family 2 protein [Neobacillus sp. OS1-2]|uniref:glycosyltransferase family 2 protein n=1 Tax=Neobacillus sp. OS1-2 TaxID=3070680 RepID=UPI0027E12C94|nr:glycosyltransferase family 2 protein [Neobacillus sp. OS1-2]WML41238.1 glycosyltransferase family 2 protein [Neobacillus sp. OS1-2]
MKKDGFIVSVVTIVNNSQDIIESYIEETSAILSSRYSNYEMVLVDNGSSDCSSTKIKELQNKFQNIRLVALSKEYDEEIARTAALDNSIGDYVVLMDMNFDPPTLIPNMIEKAGTEYDLVIGERNNRDNDTLFEGLSAKMFYSISKKLTGYNINPNYSDFVCFSRKMVNSLIQIRDRGRYLKYLNLEVGFKQTSIKYDRIKRTTNGHKRNFVNKVGFALEVIVTNSDKLLRWSALVGFFISFINLVYMVYIFGVAIFKKDVAPGWVSSSLVNTTMFFFLFLLLSIISVFVSSVLKETKKGSLYYVSEETNSSVIYKNIDKKNIV